MAKKGEKGPTLASAVERQSGACRNLASLMRYDAASRGVFDRKDRRVIETWAATLESIAEALTEALADGDKPSLRRSGKFAALLMTGLLVPTGGFAEGAGQAAYADYFGDNRSIQDCAREIVEAGEAVVIRMDEEPSKKIRSQAPAVPSPAPKPRKKSVTLHALGVELGMSDAQMMEFASTMGVGAKSPNSVLIEAQADRLRRRSHRDGPWQEGYWDKLRASPIGKALSVQPSALNKQPPTDT